jgi:hypothetical protein
VENPYSEVKDARGKVLGWVKHDQARGEWIAFGAYGRIGVYDSREDAERVHHMNDLQQAGTV